MKFADLQLESTLLSAIEQLGYQESTPIQSAVLPHVLDGKDISGLAPTGTGKTAAFLIPLMDRLLKARVNPEGMSPEALEHHQKRSFSEWKAQNFILILVPTRELAEQVQENITKLSVVSGLRSIAVYGGTGYDKQKEAFRNQVEFVVATPGRLIDLYKEHCVDLKQVRAIVFDEADRMFDMGFKDDMKYILSRVPRERQFLVFSATMNFDVINTAYQFGADPVEINVSGDQTKAENVKDEVFHVGDEEKQMYLLSILKKHNPKQAIVFSNFKYNVDRIARFLSSNGIPAMGISSLLTQAQRNRVIEQFKAENEKNILVATDVAARGLDIKGVDMVINYELPQDAESYVHRIGRTGRAGADGLAFSLSSEKDVESLARIEEYLKHKVAIGWMEDSDMVKDFKKATDGGSDRGPKGPRDSRERSDRGDRFRGERSDRRDSGRDSQRDSQRSRSRFDRNKPRTQGADSSSGVGSSQRDDSRNQGSKDFKKSAHRNEGRNDFRSDNRRSDRNSNRSNDKYSDKNNSKAHFSKDRKDKNFKDQNKNYSKHKKPQKTNGGIVQKVSGFFKKLFSK